MTGGALSGRGLGWAGPYDPTLPGRAVREAVCGRPRRRSLSLLGRRSGVKNKTTKKKRFLSNDNKQLEPSAPALREPRGEAVHRTSSPKPRPRPFPPPLVFSPDPRHVPGCGAGGRPAAVVRSQVLDVRPPPTRGPAPLGWGQGLPRPSHRLQGVPTASPGPSEKGVKRRDLSRISSRSRPAPRGDPAPAAASLGVNGHNGPARGLSQTRSPRPRPDSCPPSSPWVPRRQDKTRSRENRKIQGSQSLGGWAGRSPLPGKDLSAHLTN